MVEGWEGLVVGGWNGYGVMVSMATADGQPEICPSELLLAELQSQSPILFPTSESRVFLPTAETHH